MDFFLSAYDPLDLPGGSVDPLGFERGYVLLADKILPGLTNAAHRPRYFGLLCSGIYLAGDLNALSHREVIARREEVLLRTERFWALGNVLADASTGGDIRGVTYAKTRVDEITRTGASKADASYRLMTRQKQYGAVGVYASVADGMRFINRDGLALTPELGETMAEAFIEETGMPPVLRRAVQENGEISIGALRTWGERAHVRGNVGGKEAACIHQAAYFNPVRSRMLVALKACAAIPQEPELARLQRIAGRLKDREEDRDLFEAVQCILSYEACYRIAMLAFERLLWSCRWADKAAKVAMRDLKNDSVLTSVRNKLPKEVRLFLKALEKGNTGLFQKELEKLSDARRFLEQAVASVEDVTRFVQCILDRHTDIQRGKFDRGRRKMPWLELQDGKIQLTMTRIGGLDFEATKPEDIEAHPYRLFAADALIAASKNRS